MKTLFKPSNILFYFLSAILFFFLGMIFAGITNAGKDQGLAAGAIVFGYGIIAGFVTFHLINNGCKNFTGTIHYSDE